ncbi:MAG: hypothetical protein NXI32_30545, partial [bacterium]|nr:hypothetical protein [bacterium]
MNNNTTPSATADSELDALLQRIDGLISGGNTSFNAETPPDERPIAALDPRNRAPFAEPEVLSDEPPSASSSEISPSTAAAAQEMDNVKHTVKTAQPKSDSSKTVSFGKLTGDRDEPFVPFEPQSLEAAGLTESLVEEIIMRFLLRRGESSGRGIATQLQLPFRLVEPILNRLKYEQMTAYRGSNSVNDYTHCLTDAGRDRARGFNLRTTYFGSAPVALEHYCEAVKLQSVEGQYPRRDQLLHAFRDLLIDRKMLGRLGPAINSGRGMFLYGYPGNGKTSIAERVTLAFGKYIWIPRAILVDGEIMRLYDPLLHEIADGERGTGILNDTGIDGRWVRIKRPTI